jgi:hypothetical protein
MQERASIIIPRRRRGTGRRLGRQRLFGVFGGLGEWRESHART